MVLKTCERAAYFPFLGGNGFPPLPGFPFTGGAAFFAIGPSFRFGLAGGWSVCIRISFQLFLPYVT
jgi:hypothetical protein